MDNVLDTPVKVHITKLYVNEKDKNGNIFISKKTGKPYKKVAIETEEYGQKKWITGFYNTITDKWKIGDEVEIIVTQNGNFLNFNLTNSKVSRQEFDNLSKRVEGLERTINNSQGNPEGDIDFDESTPF